MRSPARALSVFGKTEVLNSVINRVAFNSFVLWQVCRKHNCDCLPSVGPLLRPAGFLRLFRVNEKVLRSNAHYYPPGHGSPSLNWPGSGMPPQSSVDGRPRHRPSIRALGAHRAPRLRRVVGIPLGCVSSSGACELVSVQYGHTEAPRRSAGLPGGVKDVRDRGFRRNSQSHQATFGRMFGLTQGVAPID